MYLDTSVAVKLFIPEPDSTECELIVGGAGFISSDLLYGEMQAAALGKARAVTSTFIRRSGLSNASKPPWRREISISSSSMDYSCARPRR